MTHSERLSRMKGNDIIYEFHQSIHQLEASGPVPRKQLRYRVSYNYKSSFFHEKYPCNLFYESDLSKNNIYLLLSDSGKSPYQYFTDGEANSFEKVKKTMVAHYTFMPNWFICLKSVNPKPLPKKFYKWFETYKKDFLSEYRLPKWDHIDEYSAVLLATPKLSQNVTDLISKSGYTYHTLKLQS